MFIYKTTNLINGKIYIGKSTKNNKNYLGSGRTLLKAIKKYGRENFKREIIENDINDIILLNLREIYWIEYYNSRNKKIGYNITKGGEFLIGTNLIKQENGMYGRNHTEESKRIMSLHRTGIPVSDEFKLKASTNSSGSRNPNFGVMATEEKKIKLSNGRQGKKSRNKSSLYVGVTRIANNKWRAKITQRKKYYDLGIYNSEEDAGLAYNKKAIELFGDNAKINIILDKIFDI